MYNIYIRTLQATVLLIRELPFYDVMTRSKCCLKAELCMMYIGLYSASTVSSDVGGRGVGPADEVPLVLSALPRREYFSLRKTGRKDLYSTPSSIPARGSYCCAQFTADDEWYRAKVVDVGKPTPHSALVCPVTATSLWCTSPLCPNCNCQCSVQFTHTLYVVYNPHTCCMRCTTHIHAICSVQPTCTLYAVYNPHTCCMRYTTPTHMLYVVYNPHTCCMRCTTHTHAVCGVQPPHMLYAVYNPHTRCMLCTTHTHAVCGVQPTHMLYAVYNPHTRCMYAHIRLPW